MLFFLSCLSKQRSAADDDAPGTSVPKPSSGNDTSVSMEFQDMGFVFCGLE